MNQLPSLKIYCFRKANACAGGLARKTVNPRHVLYFRLSTYEDVLSFDS